jgi:hypothetical protein
MTIHIQEDICSSFGIELNWIGDNGDGVVDGKRWF